MAALTTGDWVLHRQRPQAQPSAVFLCQWTLPPTPSASSSDRGFVGRPRKATLSDGPAGGQQQQQQQQQRQRQRRTALGVGGSGSGRGRLKERLQGAGGRICQEVEAIRKQGLLNNVLDFTEVVSALGRRGHWRDALAVVAEMREVGLAPNSFTYTALLGSLARGCRWDRALSMLSEMRQEDVEPNAFAYNAAISACEKGQQWQQALGLLLEMPRSRVPPDVVSYNSAMSACASGGRWDWALDLLRELRSQGLAPSTVSCNTAISACRRDWRTALQLLSELYDWQVAPDAITYNTALSSLSSVPLEGEEGVENQGLPWAWVLHLLGEMWASGLDPDLVTFNTALAALGGAEQWERALLLWEDLMHQGELEADQISYSAAMSAMAKGNQWERALGLWVELRAKAEGMTETPDGASNNNKNNRNGMASGSAASKWLDAAAFGAAISASEKAQSWEWALQLMQDMRARKLSPDLSHHNAAISVLGKGSQWERALFLFSEIETGRMKPDLISFNALISACGRGQCWDRALALLAEMRLRKLQPDQVSYVSAISAVEGGGLWQHALALLREMAAVRLRPPALGLASVVLACAQAGQWEQALRIFEDELLVELLSKTWSPSFTGSAQKPVMCYGSLLWQCYSTLLRECQQRDLLDQETWLLTSCSGGLAALGLGGDGSGASAACANAAAVRLLRAGRYATVTELLLAAASGTGEQPGSGVNAASRSLLALCRGSEGAQLQLAIVPPAPVSVGTPYAKELGLLRHVLETAHAGDPASVVAAVESFGQGALNLWLKVAGGSKASALTAALAGAPPGGRVLEIGTYCGFSSICMAMRLPGVKISTLELDPMHMVVARNMHAFAGLADRIEVWTGHSKDLLTRSGGPRFLQGGKQPAVLSALFMDQRGSRYDEDLAALEADGRFLPGAVVVADNVLKPGAPLFLWRVAGRGAVGQYASQILSLKEFAMPSEDWMSATVRLPPPKRRSKASLISVPELRPAELIQLDREADRMRERATSRGRSVTFDEWAAFADQMQLRLAPLGIAATAVVDEPASWEEDSER